MKQFFTSLFFCIAVTAHAYPMTMNRDTQDHARITAMINARAEDAARLYAPNRLVSWAIRGSLAAVATYFGLAWQRPDLIQKMQRSQAYKTVVQKQRALKKHFLKIPGAPLVLGAGSSLALNTISEPVLREARDLVGVQPPHAHTRAHAISNLINYLRQTTDIAYVDETFSCGFIKTIKSDEQVIENGARYCDYLIHGSLQVAAYIQYYHTQRGAADLPQKKDVRSACISDLIELIRELEQIKALKNPGEMLVSQVMINQQQITCLAALHSRLIHGITLFLEHSI